MCRGLPLLWCFQAKDKSHRADTVEVPQGGFRMNPAPCRACSSTKHQSMKVTKGNRGSFEKMSKSWESAGPGSQSRPELLLFPPADLSSLSVEWRHVYIHLLKFQISFSSFPLHMRSGGVGSRLWAFESHERRETLLQRLFSLAAVSLFSKSRAVYNKLFNGVLVPSILFFLPHPSIFC